MNIPEQEKSAQPKPGAQGRVMRPEETRERCDDSAALALRECMHLVFSGLACQFMDEAERWT